MSKTGLNNKKAAFLASNGFCEREFLQAYNAFKKVGIDCRLVSDKNALIKGWNELASSEESNWGDGYAADVLIENALASDYDILVVPGGVRSIEKLKLCLNIRSFVSAFITTGKPVVAYNRAIDLLVNTGLVNGYSLAAEEALCRMAEGSDTVCVDESFVVNKNLITLSYFEDVGDKILSAVSSILAGEEYTPSKVA